MLLARWILQDCHEKVNGILTIISHSDGCTPNPKFDIFPLCNLTHGFAEKTPPRHFFAYSGVFLYAIFSFLSNSSLVPKKEIANSTKLCTVKYRSKTISCS